MGTPSFFMASAKTIKDSREDLLNNIIECKYKYDSNDIPGLQTTTNFKLALDAYQEAIINKVRLRNVQTKYLQVRGKFKKDPL